MSRAKITFMAASTAIFLVGGAAGPSLAQSLPPSEAAPPSPFAYVGKVRDGNERFAAVLEREDRVHEVRPGDTLDGGFRVESIGEEQMVVIYLPLGSRQVLPFGGMAPATVTKAAKQPYAPDGEQVALHIIGPGQVAIGEEFTVMLGLEPGAVGMIQDGNVELAYDPRVLRPVGGALAAGGRAQVTIAGTHTGHSAPAAVKFRVVASAPTATEIRVIPSDVADLEGRQLAVVGPDGHRLIVVQP